MKQALMIQGSVELSRHEITTALSTWLKEKYNLMLKKSVYVVEGKNIARAVIEVRQATTDSIPDFSTKIKEERNSKKGFKRNNVGIFSFIREYLEDEKKKKNKTVAFDELYASVKDFFPKIDKNHLVMYLYDKRQLPGVKFKDKVITIGGN